MSETGPADPVGPDGPDDPRRAGNGGPPIETMPFLARLLAPVTAVAVVIVVIVLLIWINGGSSHNGQSPAAVGPGPVDSPVGSAPRTRSGSPTPTPPVRRPAHRHPRAAVAAVAPVTVLNNSRRTGLAHAVAGEVRAKGWDISMVGNLQGLVAETTVYYAPGDAAAAKHLAREFTSIRRVETNHAGNIHGNALTLVVTRDWTL